MRRWRHPHALVVSGVPVNRISWAPPAHAVVDVEFGGCRHMDRYISSTGAVTGGQFQNTFPLKGGNFCSDFSLPHCHHHGPQGNDPYPAEGAPGCPAQQSAKGPTECDADAAADHANFKADKWTFAGGVSATSGEDAMMKVGCACGFMRGIYATTIQQPANFAHDVPPPGAYPGALTMWYGGWDGIYGGGGQV